MLMAWGPNPCLCFESFDTLAHPCQRVLFCSSVFQFTFKPLEDGDIGVTSLFVIFNRLGHPIKAGFQQFRCNFHSAPNRLQIALVCREASREIILVMAYFSLNVTLFDHLLKTSRLQSEHFRNFRTRSNYDFSLNFDFLHLSLSKTKTKRKNENAKSAQRLRCSRPAGGCPRGWKNLKARGGCRPSCHRFTRPWKPLNVTCKQRLVGYEIDNVMLLCGL